MRPLVLVLLILPLAASAQELRCEVSLNTRALGGEFDYLDELRDEITRYVNGRTWTDDVYDPEERVACQIQVTMTEAVTQTLFNARLVVQANRPIYGTAQRTTTLRVADNSWRFNYARGQNLIYDPNRFDELTSVLDFYALMILGYDYDTFSPLGGTEFFERAQRIAELSRAVDAGQPGGGWFGRGAEDRARSTLVQELLDPVFEPVRRAQFDYHFGVLDHFVLRPQQAWAKAIETLTALHELYLVTNRRRYVTDVFFGAKFEEFVDLLEEAPQRNEAYAMLSEMDSAHIGAYDALVNSR